MYKLLFTISLFFLMNSQTAFEFENLSLRSSIGMTGRYEGPELNSPYAIKDREPAMTDFFTGSPFYEFALEYAFVSKNTDEVLGHFFFGSSYMFESLNKRDKSILKDDIGHDLNIDILSFYFGYALYHNRFSKRDFYFISAGYSIPNYEATGKDELGKFTTTYETDAALLLSLGSTNSLSKSLSLTYALTLMPYQVEAKDKIQDDIHEEIESDYPFHDTTIRFKIGLAYYF